MKNKLIIIIFVFILTVIIAFPIRAVEPDETPSGIPLSEMDSAIDDYMNQYIGLTSPGAAVVVVKDGRIIFSKGYGYANMEEKIPVDSGSTVFEYGSISKIFVYTAVMRLYESGRISLDKDIRSYLPEGFLKKLKYDDPITMLNIMNHTAGFEDYLFDVILPSPDNLPSLEHTLLNSQPVQVYKPGTISSYSNYAVSLAAYIAERMLEQDFYAYLMDTIFLPLGMNHTSAHQVLADNRNLVEQKAKGYLSKGDGDFTIGPWSYLPLYPAGSVNGTAEDLARFAMAFMPEAGQASPLFEGRSTLEEMLSQSYSMGPGMTGFAHGFIEWDGQYRSVGHGGNTAAFSSQFNLVPQERFGVIVLTNAAGEMDITSGLTDLLIGRQEKVVFSGVEGLPDSKEIEGIYLNARRMYSRFLEFYAYLTPLTVKALDHNRIVMSMGGQSATLEQIRPYLYERISADGPIFKYHFNPVYFTMQDGKVNKISGDFQPLTDKRTVPWLIAYVVLLVVSVLYFMVVPFIILIRHFYRRKNNTNVPEQGLGKINILLLFDGLAIVSNNIILVVRMLINNYRSFSEMQIHIALNWFLALFSAILIVLSLVSRKDCEFTKGQRALHWITVSMIIALILLLIDWKFFAFT